MFITILTCVLLRGTRKKKFNYIYIELLKRFSSVFVEKIPTYYKEIYPGRINLSNQRNYR